MDVKTENLEKNMAKLTIEVPEQKVAEALTAAYNKNKNKFSIPGFRKGKVPQQMVEKYYGVQVLYEDAIQVLLNESYPEAAKESGLDIVSRPSINIEKMEKGQAFVYTAEVALKPEVVLGEYKGIKVDRAKPDVTEEDIAAELKKVQEQNSRLVTVTDRPAANGDETVIDFDGSVDGVPFEGGKAEDYPLTLGSHSFIDGFEDQIVGMNIGDKKDISVTFPENYHAKDLAGKPAVFAVALKELKARELPELNDEFASNVSDFETFDEYKADIVKKLAERKQAAATTENEQNVVAKVVAGATLEIPAPMLEDEVESTLDRYSRQMMSQGISMEQYYQFTGMTRENLLDQIRPDAETRIRTRLVLEAVVKAENITASDEAVEEELQKMADRYKLELDKVKEMVTGEQLDSLKEELAVREAIDFLVAEAELV